MCCRKNEKTMLFLQDEIQYVGAYQVAVRQGWTSSHGIIKAEWLSVHPIYGLQADEG